MGVFEILMIVVSAVALAANVGGTIYTNKKEQQNYEDMKEYNSPLEQVKRLEQAGLNPNLASGGVNTVTQQPQVANPAESLVNLPGMLQNAYNSGNSKERLQLTRQQTQLQKLKYDIQLKLADQAMKKGDMDLALKALSYDTAVQTQPAAIEKAFADAGFASNRKSMSDIDLASYDTFRGAVVQHAVEIKDKTHQELVWLRDIKPALEWYKAETGRKSVEFSHADRVAQLEQMKKFKEMDNVMRQKQYDLAVKNYNLAVQAQNWEKAHYWSNVIIGALGAGVKAGARMYGIPVK